MVSRDVAQIVSEKTTASSMADPGPTIAGRSMRKTGQDLQDPERAHADHDPHENSVSPDSSSRHPPGLCGIGAILDGLVQDEIRVPGESPRVAGPDEFTIKTL